MNTGIALVLLVAPATAVLVLAVRHDGPAALGRIHLRGKGWVFAAAAVQYLRGSGVAGDAGLPDGVLLALLCACGLGFALANARGASRAARWSLGSAVLGLALNALATVVNGGMPFSVPGARAAGMSEAAIAAPPPGHVPMDGGTHLAVLADVVPVPGLHIVFSLGDVLLWAGLAGYLVAAATATHVPPGDSAGVGTPRATEPAR